MNRRISRAPVVIIGGGVAGLTATNLLARNDVAIFEASDKLGGSCATTKLGGYTFNDGAVSLALIGVLPAAKSESANGFGPCHEVLRWK